MRSYFLETDSRRRARFGFTIALCFLAWPAVAEPILIGDLAETDFVARSSAALQPFAEPTVQLGERMIARALNPVPHAQLHSAAIASLRLYDADGRVLRKLQHSGRVALLHVKR